MRVCGVEIVTKAELRVELDVYKEALRALARENYRAQRDLDIARGHIIELAEFLAVLQGDQIAEQPPNTEPN